MADLGLLLHRLAFGGLMLAAHGWPKLANYSTYVQQFPDPIGLGAAISLNLAIFAELVCALLVVVGLFHRLAAVPLAFTMVVAAFVVHAADPFAKKEMALLYLAGYLVIILAGAGKYSLHSALKISSGSRLPFMAWLLKN